MLEVADETAEAARRGGLATRNARLRRAVRNRTEGPGDRADERGSPCRRLPALQPAATGTVAAPAAGPLPVRIVRKGRKRSPPRRPQGSGAAPSRGADVAAASILCSQCPVQPAGLPASGRRVLKHARILPGARWPRRMSARHGRAGSCRRVGDLQLLGPRSPHGTSRRRGRAPGPRASCAVPAPLTNRRRSSGRCRQAREDGQVVAGLAGVQEIVPHVLAALAPEAAAQRRVA
jgi:hypothetical protein